MRKFIDLNGKQFGRLIVLRNCGKDKSGGYLWECQCTCPEKNIRIVTSSNLIRGHTKSCGCLNTEKIGIRSKKYNTYNLDGEFGIGYTFNGDEFYFDLEDYEKIKDYCWCLNNASRIISQINPNNDYPEKEKYQLSRLVMNANKDDPIVDHINRIPIDNRKSNLRFVDNTESAINKGKRSDNTSGIIGVSWNKRDKRWSVELNKYKKRYRIGNFKNKKMQS